MGPASSTNSEVTVVGDELFISSDPEHSVCTLYDGHIVNYHISHPVNPTTTTPSPDTTTPTPDTTTPPPDTTTPILDLVLLTSSIYPSNTIDLSIAINSLASSLTDSHYLMSSMTSVYDESVQTHVTITTSVASSVLDPTSSRDKPVTRFTSQGMSPVQSATIETSTSVLMETTTTYSSIYQTEITSSFKTIASNPSAYVESYMDTRELSQASEVIYYTSNLSPSEEMTTVIPTTTTTVPQLSTTALPVTSSDITEINPTKPILQEQTPRDLADINLKLNVLIIIVSTVSIFFAIAIVIIAVATFYNTKFLRNVPEKPSYMARYKGQKNPVYGMETKETEMNDKHFYY